MNRRGFLVSLLAVPLAPLAAKKLTIIQPIPLGTMHGIPYHQPTSTVGTWAGITRSTHPHFSSLYSGAAGGGKSLMLTKDMMDKYLELYRKGS